MGLISNKQLIVRKFLRNSLSMVRLFFESFNSSRVGLLSGFEE